MSGFLSLYKDAGKVLRTFFMQIGFFKILLPLDMLFLILGFGIPFLANFLGILPGIIGSATILGSLSIFLFVLGILLGMANGHTQYVYIGMFAMAATKLLLFLKFLLRKGSYFSWSYLFGTLVIGGIALLIMKYCSGVTAED